MEHRHQRASARTDPKIPLCRACAYWCSRDTSHGGGDHKHESTAVGLEFSCSLIVVLSRIYIFLSYLISFFLALKEKLYSISVLRGFVCSGNADGRDGCPMVVGEMRSNWRVRAHPIPMYRYSINLYCTVQHLLISLPLEEQTRDDLDRASANHLRQVFDEWTTQGR